MQYTWYLLLHLYLSIVKFKCILQNTLSFADHQVATGLLHTVWKSLEKRDYYNLYAEIYYSRLCAGLPPPPVHSSATAEGSKSCGPPLPTFGQTKKHNSPKRVLQILLLKFIEKVSFVNLIWTERPVHHPSILPSTHGRRTGPGPMGKLLWQQNACSEYLIYSTIPQCFPWRACLLAGWLP